jgi:hypothetical protein
MKPSIDIKKVEFSIEKCENSKELCYHCSVQVNDITYNNKYTTRSKVSPMVVLNSLMERTKEDVRKIVLDMEKHRGVGE